MRTSRAESASEVDWEAFVHEDEMLPPSNWEEEFRRHKDRLMDRYSYKGLIEAEVEPDLGNGEDEPWYPYDPEDVLNAYLDPEMDGVVLTDRTDGQATICYGMVSTSRVRCASSVYEYFMYRSH